MDKYIGRLNNFADEYIPDYALILEEVRRSDESRARFIEKVPQQTRQLIYQSAIESEGFFVELEHGLLLSMLFDDDTAIWLWEQMVNNVDISALPPHGRYPGGPEYLAAKHRMGDALPPYDLDVLAEYCKKHPEFFEELSKCLTAE